MTDFRNNHYVPQWYQERFLPNDGRERKFYYLDLAPDTVVSPGGRKYRRAALLRWGPKRCFSERDLYTTQLGNWLSTDIERYFFGDIDNRGKRAVEYFADFAHPSADHEAFDALIRYLSIQKLCTPKGLAALGVFASKGKGRCSHGDAGASTNVLRYVVGMRLDIGGRVPKLCRTFSLNSDHRTFW